MNSSFGDWGKADEFMKTIYLGHKSNNQADQFDSSEGKLL
jgi:hypothetical protein